MTGLDLDTYQKESVLTGANRRLACPIWGMNLPSLRRRGIRSD